MNPDDVLMGPTRREHDHVVAQSGLIIDLAAGGHVQEETRLPLKWCRVACLGWNRTMGHGHVVLDNPMMSCATFSNGGSIACGTGGMLIVGEETLAAMGAQRNQQIECQLWCCFWRIWRLR